MVEGGIYSYVIPAGRIITGFFVGAMLGIVGGWMGLTFNHMIQFPWALEVHRNIYIASIGLGAGLGAYLGWISLSLRWYGIAASVFLVMVGGVAGSFMGNLYGQIAEPTFMGTRDTIVNKTHLGAAIGAIVVSTALGLFNHFRTRS